MSQAIADRVLKASGRAWWAVAAVGQFAFVGYVILFYGRTAAEGDFERWNEVLVGGYRSGQPVGNLALAAHLALAVVITAGGLLQLVPAIRARAPWLHRWNGRVFLTCALVASLAGVGLVWTRGTAGELAMRAGITVNAVLIIVCGLLAWRLAAARRFDAHRRWALRAFVLVSGVWFFRVGLMAWILANRGPVGIGEDFDGPFVRFWAYGCYLVPLAGVELWMGAWRGGRVAKLVAAVVVGLLTLVTALGVFGTIAGMWLPRVV